MMAELQDQAIRQHCKALRMPTIGTQFARLADAAAREGQSHVGYLEALLAAGMEGGGGPLHPPKRKSRGRTKRAGGGGVGFSPPRAPGRRICPPWRRATMSAGRN